MKKIIGVWPRAAAFFLLLVMMISLVPLPAAGMEIQHLDWTDPTEEIVDLSDPMSPEEVEQTEELRPEISVSPEPPAISEPDGEDTLPGLPSQPVDGAGIEFVPEAPSQTVQLQNKAVLLTADGSVKSGSATQKLQRHANYQYYHVFEKRVVQWSSVTIGGKLAYCVDLTTFRSTEGINMGSSTVYNSLTTDQKYALGHVLQYGSKDVSDVPYYIATQTLIWEVVHGHGQAHTMKTAALSGNFAL